MEVRTLGDSDLAQAYEIKNEYLDQSPYPPWAAMRAKYPDLFAGLFHRAKLVGICYGWPFHEQRPEVRDAILLNGIAVVHPFNGQGHGGRLLRFFEGQVARRGAARITLGSAGGYVDRFYVKNGYAPTHFMIRFPADREPSPSLRAKYRIENERVVAGTRVLYAAVDTLDKALRERLKRDFTTDDVVAIMETRLLVR